MKKPTRQKHKKMFEKGQAWCSTFKKFLPLDQFNNYSSRWNGVQGICKEARKLQHQQSCDGHWTVYELPSGHIGQTTIMVNRMSQHKSMGRTDDVNNFKVLAICHCEDEALDLEALYQSLSPNYEKPDSQNRLKQPKDD